MRTKFYTLMVLGIALIAALGWAGWGSIVLEADKLHVVPVISACFLVGLICAWRGDWRRAIWVGDMLPVISLVYTVAGVLLAFHEHPDLNAATGAEVGRALVANMFGFGGMGWLKLVREVCGDTHEE